MKNIFFFYLAILAPLAGVIWLGKAGHINAFAACLLGYAFIYRSLTDGYRLIGKGLIKRNDLWKMFIPFWLRPKYFMDLYFK